MTRETAVADVAGDTRAGASPSVEERPSGEWSARRGIPALQSRRPARPYRRALPHKATPSSESQAPGRFGPISRWLKAQPADRRGRSETADTPAHVPRCRHTRERSEPPNAVNTMSFRAFTAFSLFSGGPCAPARQLRM